MAIPNLICMIMLADVLKSEVERFQPILEAEEAAKSATEA